MHCQKAGKPLPTHICSIRQRSFTRDDNRKRHEKEAHLNVARLAKRTVAEETIESPGKAPEMSDPRTSPSKDNTEPLPATELSEGESGTAIGAIRIDASHRSCADETSHLLVCSAFSGDDQGFGQASCSTSGEKGDMDVDDSGDRQPGAEETEHDFESRRELDPDNVSVRTSSTTGSSTSRLKLQVHIHRSVLVERSRASPKPSNKSKLPPLCAICHTSFGSTTREVRAHLDQHATFFSKDPFSCSICQIGFEHERDFYHHQRSANLGCCGFAFDHAGPCQGHHPPGISTGGLNDNDRAQFESRLQHWEDNQRRTHMSEVHQLAKGRFFDDPINGGVDERSERWTINGQMNPLDSVTSFMSNLKVRSDPDPVEYQGRLDNKYVAVVSAPIRAARNTAKFLGISKVQYRKKIQNLRAAIDTDDVRLVRTLIMSGADVNGQAAGPVDYRSSRPLVAAARTGNINFLNLLITNGAKVDIMDQLSRPLTPLCVATACGNYDATIVLLENGAKVDKSGGAYHETAACLAAARGDLAILAVLLQHGANANWISKFDDFPGLNSYSALQSHEAFSAQGAKDYGDAIRKTAFHAYGIQLHNKIARRFKSVLGYAVGSRKRDVVKLLLKRGAQPQSPWEYECILEDIISNGDKDILELILSSGKCWTHDVFAMRSALIAAISNSASSCDTMPPVMLLIERLVASAAVLELSEVLDDAIPFVVIE